MVYKLLFCLLFLFHQISLLAQTTNESRNEPITLIESTGKSMTTGMTTSISYSFRVGEKGKTTSTGYLGSGLEPYIKDNKEAMNELSSFKSHRVQSIIGYGVCLGSVAIGAIVGFQEQEGTIYDPSQGKTVPKGGKMTTVGIVSIITAVGGLIYGGYNYFAASPHMFKAVETYNWDLNKADVTDNALRNFKLDLKQNGLSLLYFF